jgi:methanogenic corrinoid protein MtbC1
MPSACSSDDYRNGLASRAVSATSPTIALDRLCARYLDAQLAGDRRAALHVVIDEGLAGGYSVSDLQAGIVQAAQSEIGRLWQQNRIGIAQEHMATAISHVVASRLFEEATPQARLGKQVMVACVEGEYHEFPARLVADFLDLGGFDVLYLGANVPTDHLIAMLRDTAPDVLALSVTMSFNVASLRDAIVRVRAALPGLPILVGGHALAWEPGLADAAGVHTCGPEASRVVGSAKRLTGIAA